MRSFVHGRALVLMTMMLVSSRAAAAPPSEGEQLFREGRSAMQAHDYERACSRFAESHSKEPAPGTALNLGECEEQRGHLIAAAAAFTLAASTFTSADKQKYATARAEAAERKIPRIKVRASSPVPGLVVHAGDVVVTVGAETKMDPGEIVILAEAPQHYPKQMKAVLVEGKSVDVDLGALERERPPEPPAVAVVPTDSRTDLRPLGLVTGGIGVAALAVGAVTGILALDRASTVKEHCDGGLACDPQGLDAADGGSTFSSISTVSFIGGAVLVAGGAALLLFGGRRSAPPSIAPATSPSSLLLHGTF